jgi:hypothetical protein
MNPVPVMTDNTHFIPRQYEGFAGRSWMSYPELCSLIAQLPTTGVLLEIGSASGVTAAVISKSRPDLRVICLDTFTSPVNGPDHFADNDQDRREHWHQNRQSNMELFDCTVEIYILVGSCCPEFVLIDGDHSYRGVWDDLASSALFEPERIFLHDYEDPFWTGVKPAVDEFCEQHRYEIINRCNSLVTLRRRSCEAS